MIAGAAVVGLGSHGPPSPRTDAAAPTSTTPTVPTSVAASPPPPLEAPDARPASAPAVVEPPPGPPVTVVLRDGRSIEAWLVAFDGATGRLECVERGTRARRTLRREEVRSIDHVAGERGDAPR